jgi:hypothetical protein
MRKSIRQRSGRSGIGAGGRQAVVCSPATQAALSRLELIKSLRLSGSSKLNIRLVVFSRKPLQLKGDPQSSMDFVSRSVVAEFALIG